MPLSECHRIATKGKVESTPSKMTNCPSDVSSFMPEHEFVELLWENGQIVMQGPSSRPKKSSFPTSFSSHTLRVQDKEDRDATNPKTGQFGAVESMVNDLSPAVPSGHFGLNAQDDDMAPWISYPVEDSLPHDYCSDFFSELSGVNLNSLSTQNYTGQTHKSSGFGVKDFHSVEHGHTCKAITGGSEPNRIRTSQLLQLPQQCQTSVPITKLRETDFGIGGSSSRASHEGACTKQDVVIPKPLQPSSGAGLMNFSHFSRPAAIAKANLQSADRSRSNDKVLTAASTNPIESTLIESTGGSKSVFGVRGQLGSDLAKVELRSSAKPQQEVVSLEESEAICQEDTSRSNHQNSVVNNNGASPDHMNYQSSSFAASMALGRHETKGLEAAVASSSVCSGNSAGAASDDPKHRAKRRNQEGEYQSEDLEDESVGVKKPVTGRGGTSTKRTRAAEVHNLSERRRRDRINEKMRALQELIPNCNKVDKASMLDEAIEYLKTLQLQVQMMSMGSALCMPPMMLPPGMQHMRASPMAHFPPMGVGMGMGMGLGYGLGMFDMNSSPGCPMIPVPPMHAPQFPCPSMPGSTGLQLFGIPGQGLPVSMPCPPLFNPLSGLAAKGNSVTEVRGTMTNPLPVSDAAPPPSSSKDQEQQQERINLAARQKPSTDGSPIQTSSQAAKGSFEQSPLMQMSIPALHAGSNGAVSSTGDTGNVPTRATRELKYMQGIYQSS